MPLLCIATLSFVFTSCSEKFNIAAPYKNITVVYGILDKADTAHYIRIEKAFLDNNKSFLTMAQVPDSSYYANLHVVIKRISMSYGNVVDSILPVKVDLANEGYIKSPGAFFTAPNYAYKFKDVLNPEYIYRIFVTNGSSGETDSSDAPIIEDQDTTAFSVNMFETFTNLLGLGITSSNENLHTDFIGQYNPPADFNFEGSLSPVYVMQMYIRFNWLDSNTVTGVKTVRYSDYNVDQQLIASSSNQSFDFKLTNLAFYNAVSAGLGTPGDSVTVRLMGKLGLTFYAATNDYYQYMQASALQGVGLTATDVEPTYTNMKGANVLGLYTSRGSRTGQIALTQQTIDSLMASPITANAKIVGTAY